MNKYNEDYKKKWLEDELADIRLLRKMQIYFLHRKRELSNSARDAIEASEKAIQSLRKEIYDRHIPEDKADARPYRITYGGTKGQGRSTKDTNNDAPEFQQKDLGL